MQPNESYLIHNVTTARVFTVVVVMMAAMIWLSRGIADAIDSELDGFINLVRVVLMGLALIWVKPLADCLLSRNTSAVAFLGVIFLLFLPWSLLQLLPLGFGRVLVDLIFAAFTCGCLIYSSRKYPLKGTAAHLLFGILFAFALFTVLVGQGYITPFTYENALLGVQHHDTLFHAALAGMIETHGTVSVGLDGLIPVSYHVLNHRLTGSIATWLNLPVLQALYLFVMVVTLPLLFKFLCDAVYALNPQGWPPISPVPALIFFLCWPMAFSLLQPSAYYSSESYILSLVVLLGAIPIMQDWAEEKPVGMAFWVAGLALAVAVLLAGMAKISTGAVMAAGLSGLMVLAGRFSVFSFLWAFVFCIAPFLLLFISSHGAETQAAILFSPFHFLIDWREAALFHIILVAVTGGVFWLFKNRIPERSVVLTALFLMALAALGSSMILKLEAGAAIYFANPGMWICILILAVVLPTPEWPRKVSTNSQFVIAILVFAGIATLEKDRWKSLDAIAFAQAPAQDQSRQSTLLNTSLVNQVEETVKEHGRGFLVFVGPYFDTFWSQRSLCWTQSFVIPALTGQPMLKGLPPKTPGCEITSNYGFNVYDRNTARSEYLEDNQLCSAAEKRNFSRVLRFDDQNGRFVDCQR